MSPSQWLAAYQQMSFIRAFEQRLDQLFMQGALAGTTHLCVGQEACAVGVCLALEAPDVLFSNHRGHGHLLARGGDPARLMAEIMGRPLGYSGGRGGSQHVAVRSIGFLGTHGITAGTIPLAVGAALEKKRQRQPGVAVPFFGDGACGEGILHESLNLAALWHLPVLFVCENNQYAMSSAHRTFSPVPNVADRAAAYGMRSLIADGNDMAAVYAAAAEARAYAVATPAPILLELKTFRVSGHSRGDQCLYRSRAEEAEWRARDPLALARAHLTAHAGWDDARQAALDAEVTAAVDAVERTARGDAPAAAGGPA